MDKATLIADAREAASDKDWKTAAQLFREAGDETSAASCERRLQMEEEQRINDEKGREAIREAIKWMANNIHK